MLPHTMRSHLRRGRLQFSIPKVLVVSLGVIAALSPVAVNGSGPSTTPGLSDVMLARSALAALDADPQLKEINLVVSVVDRVAVIGGPVPTADHSKRAEGIIRNVPGIAEVKNKCFVQAAPDPLLQAIAGRIGPMPRSAATDLPSIVPPLKSAKPVDSTPLAPDTAIAMAEPPAKTVVAQKPSIPGGVSGILLPPVAVRPPITPPAASSSPAALTSVPPATAPAAIPHRAGNIQTAVDAIRKGDTRYAALTAEERDGTLVITGTAPRVSDAWDFAQAVRRVPGVVRVVVGAVDAR